MANSASLTPDFSLQPLVSYFSLETANEFYETFRVRELSCLMLGTGVEQFLEGCQFFCLILLGCIIFFRIHSNSNFSRSIKVTGGWPSGRASASQPVGRGFEPQPSHTKDF